MKRTVFAFACLFVLGAGIRALDLWHPVDRTMWRESDVAAIARNYNREGMNLFYPRIDWRGDGPGYAEMEFPVYPWAIAVLYKVFGVHEVIGRILSFLFALAALSIFFKLARYLLPDTGAVIASLFFVLSPVVISISNSLQPDGLMFLWYLLAVYAFVRWLDDDSQKYFVLAILATALAILAKASAAHLGILFALLILQKQGLGAVRNWRNWVFGAGALLPGLMWYRHAHRLWLTYGISLGVSNETHWAGWDLFTNSSFIRGILANELTYVWMPAGIVVVAFGLLLFPRTKAFQLGLAWSTAVFLFFLVAARTMGDSWAFYYHVIAVPPFALLVGQSVEEARRIGVRQDLARYVVVLLAILAGLMGLLYLSGLAADRSPLLLKGVALVVLTALMLALLFIVNRTEDALVGWRRPVVSAGMVTLVIGLLAATFLFQIRENRQVLAVGKSSDLLSCSALFAPAIPAGELMIASGGPCVDPTGYPVAFNASYMFYWMDRKGFNICVEKQSLPMVESLAQRGARFFVAEKSALAQKPGFEAELRRFYPVASECNAAVMFTLRPDPKTSPAVIK
ncbi:MAG: glycosyltransferase family 39 protein [Pyrinomonadaceae bacterium]